MPRENLTSQGNLPPGVGGDINNLFRILGQQEQEQGSMPNQYLQPTGSSLSPIETILYYTII